MAARARQLHALRDERGKADGLRRNLDPFAIRQIAYHLVQARLSGVVQYVRAKLARHLPADRMRF